MSAVLETNIHHDKKYFAHAKSVNALFEPTAVVFCSASGQASWFDLVREGEVLGELRRLMFKMRNECFNFVKTNIW